MMATFPGGIGDGDRHVAHYGFGYAHDDGCEPCCRHECAAGACLESVDLAWLAWWEQDLSWPLRARNLLAQAFRAWE